MLQSYEFFGMPDYNIYYNDSSINKADGVVMYVNKCLNETTTIKYVDNFKFLSTKISLKNKNNIKITGVYRCHGITQLNFIDIMDKYLKINKHTNNNCIVGDFNIDIMEDNHIVNDYISNFLESGYLPCFKGITRPNTSNSSSGSCIDNIFIKANEDGVRACKYTNPFIDHLPLFLSFQTKKTQTKKTYSYSSINYDTLQMECGGINWNFVSEQHDPNTATNMLVDAIQHAIERATTVTVMKQSRQGSKWITRGIIKSCEINEKLYKRWRNDIHNEFWKEEYKKYEKNLNVVIFKAKQKYEKKNNFKG